MEYKKNKFIVLITLAIILIIIIVILIVKLKNLSKENENTIFKSENIIKNEIIENNIQNNTVAENNLVVENNMIEQINNKEDTNQNFSITDPLQEIDKKTIEKSKSDIEKALEIVKKDWGEDNTVYFYYEYNGKHTVFVKDYQTTHVICEYRVNVDNGTFEKVM